MYLKLQLKSWPAAYKTYDQEGRKELNIKTVPSNIKQHFIACHPGSLKRITLARSGGIHSCEKESKAMCDRCAPLIPPDTELCTSSGGIPCVRARC